MLKITFLKVLISIKIITQTLKQTLLSLREEIFLLSLIKSISTKQKYIIAESVPKLKRDFLFC